MRLRLMGLRSVLVLSIAGAANVASAETLTQALSRAYNLNSTLKAQRADLRASDETMPQAKAGFLPSVNATLSAAASGTNGNGAAVDTSSKRYQAGIELNQALFRGFRTVNSVRQAEANIRAARANLANTEITVLLNSSLTYIDVVRDRELLALQKRNLQSLNEQVRAARARLDVGEGTRTDVAQALAQQAATQAAIISAEGSLAASEASYVELIGGMPQNLVAPRAPSHLVPASLSAARSIALARHPALKAVEYAADAQKFGVKLAEGALLPSVNLTGSASRTVVESSTNTQTNEGSIIASVSIPLFQGGANHSRVRQAKQSLYASEDRMQATRKQVLRQVDQAWAQLTSARAAVSANRARLEASQLALSGVTEERKVGQRTTLDVLNAQTTVNDARIGLAQAQANQISAAYRLAATTGRMNARALDLGVQYYDDQAYYEHVKDKWLGLRSASAQ